jgi:hypothetical protein
MMLALGFVREVLEVYDPLGGQTRCSIEDPGTDDGSR